MKNIHHYKNKKLVNNVFDNVYQNYDLMNDIMSFGSHRLWKEEFVKSLDLNLEYKIVDMASGTGDIAKLFFNYTNARAEILCLEPNTEMYKEGKIKLNKAKRAILSFINEAFNSDGKIKEQKYPCRCGQCQTVFT